MVAVLFYKDDKLVFEGTVKGTMDEVETKIGSKIIDASTNTGSVAFKDDCGNINIFPNQIFLSFRIVLAGKKGD